MSTVIEKKDQVVIKFAGDSGDGMQLTGNQFTNTAALFGNDISTFPDFPAEIRAPQGTLPGVSGFQLNFSNSQIFTPGDECDVLVAMNSAALKVNLKALAKGGIILADPSGFDAKNLRLAGYETSPLEDGTLSNYKVYQVDATRLTREALTDITLGVKEKDRCKNMFVLGFLYWMYDRDMLPTLNGIEEKFKKKPDIMEANIRTLKAGYNFGDTTETISVRYHVDKAKLSSGTYRSIMGNEAVTLGLIAASKLSGLELFFGTYPITPASDILHMLAKHKNFGIKTFQAEDEISAVCSAIGAAFGGALGVTATSGPGMALKMESIGLAVMLEMPLVICDIQRAGPSTGLPTKTEQSDLLQALYGRNGECPLAVISSSSPSDAFETVIEACRIAVQHMTPVIFFSDNYIANGAEPWKFPKMSDLKPFPVSFARENGVAFQPYKRDEKLVRPWAVPGTKGLEHRIGGLEKQDITGNISYEPENHEHMVKTRQAKIDMIANYIPEQKLDQGEESGDILVIGWGSTYGAIKSAVGELIAQGHKISHAHVRYLNPLPKNLGDMIKRFKKVVVPELNNGQLVKVIRDKYLVDAIPHDKIQGVPFTKRELIAAFKNYLA